MADIPFLQLSDNWRLAYDPLQWVIQKREGKQWRSEQFIASTREVLMRCLREMEVEVTLYHSRQYKTLHPLDGRVPRAHHTSSG